LNISIENKQKVRQSACGNYTEQCVTTNTQSAQWPRWVWSARSSSSTCVAGWCDTTGQQKDFW